MDYIIKYLEEKETNPIKFLNHFRCTTEPIGGGTEHDDEGELVHYDAAIAAISIAEKAIIEKACKWLENNVNNYIFIDDYLGKVQPKISSSMFDNFKKAMEE